MTKQATIIPIAGGKGGIGKSIVAANLAISLARMGRDVVAVDLDLGGSNLHSYLGLPNTLASIGDFLKSRSGDLNEFVHPTWQPGLRFLPGDGRTPFLANVGHAQKSKLIRKLRAVEADYILLDLGAGSSYNILDFFAMSSRGMLVTNSEQPALMGMLVFLKNFLFRLIARELRNSKTVCDYLEELYSQPVTAEKITVAQLHENIQRIDPDSGEQLAKLISRCTPRIVLNEGYTPDDLVNRLSPACKAITKMLSIEVEHFGFVFADDAVGDAVDAGSPLLDFDPECLATRGINILAERVNSIWDRPIRDSEEKLLTHTRQMYAELQMTASSSATSF